MKTNSVPYSDQPPGATPDNTRVANFYQNDRVDNGYDDGYAATGSNYISGLNYLTDVALTHRRPAITEHLTRVETCTNGPKPQAALHRRETWWVLGQRFDHSQSGGPRLRVSDVSRGRCWVPRGNRHP